MEGQRPGEDGPELALGSRELVDLQKLLGENEQIIETPVVS